MTQEFIIEITAAIDNSENLDTLLVELESKFGKALPSWRHKMSLGKGQLLKAKSFEEAQKYQEFFDSFGLATKILIVGGPKPNVVLQREGRSMSKKVPVNQVVMVTPTKPNSLNRLPEAVRQRSTSKSKLKHMLDKSTPLLLSAAITCLAPAIAATVVGSSIVFIPLYTLACLFYLIVIINKVS